jgi:hypothetical protein
MKLNGHVPKLEDSERIAFLQNALKEERKRANQAEEDQKSYKFLIWTIWIVMILAIVKVECPKFWHSIFGDLSWPTAEYQEE